MNKCIAAVASFVVGVALFSGASLAADPFDTVSDPAVAAPLYAVKPPRDFADVKLATAGTVGSQSVAVNPKNAARVVAAFVATTGCHVRASADGGRTWAAAKKLPMPAGTQSCDLPALTWAPDGSRIYAAYSYERRDDAEVLTESGAVVSASKDQGATWSSPVNALRYTDPNVGIGAGFAGVLRLATPLRQVNANWVYLLADVTMGSGGAIVFTRSTDRARTWSPDRALRFYGPETGIYGLAMAGGPGGNVLVTSSFFFPLEPPVVAVQVVRSGDYGRHFADAIDAVPNAAAHKTAVVFSIDGTAHIAYNGEQISYVYSSKAPYTSWSSPVPLNDDIGGWPALSASACGSGASVLHAVWIDNRLGPDTYNVFYARKVARPDKSWSPSLRVSGAPMAEDFRFNLGIGAGVNNAVGLWGVGHLYDGPNAVWASRIAPGVSCP